MKLSAAEKKAMDMESCPSRGTWIEILQPSMVECEQVVVPLAGHVD